MDRFLTERQKAAINTAASSYDNQADPANRLTPREAALRMQMDPVRALRIDDSLPGNPYANLLAVDPALLKAAEILRNDPRVADALGRHQNIFYNLVNDGVNPEVGDVSRVNAFYEFNDMKKLDALRKYDQLQMIEDQRDAAANESIIPDAQLKPRWKN